MRNLFLVGAVAISLAAGVVGSKAANPNVPQSSPYTLMDVDPTIGRPASQMFEGRAAYVEDTGVAASHRHMAPRGGDIVIHTGRSYLDPGTSAEIGTEDRYFYDTAHYDLNSEGPDFTRNGAGFGHLPGQFGPN